MSLELLKQPIEWIDSDALLERCCLKWEACSLLALDTEFVRETTYYPIAGLIQVNDGEVTYLIDPLEISDWYPFIEILDDTNRTIAMHSCSEDLEVLQIEVGTVPAKILDTQVAVALLGQAFSQGYAAVVKNELGCEIPKSETRSDWLKRPLSQPQIQYAALDVEYLFILAEKIIGELTQRDRLSWALEEGIRLFKNFKQLQDANNSYLRVKSAWKLSPRKLAVLMALSRWREDYAQQENMPRNRVIKERALFELALSSPTHISKLRDAEGVSERIIRSQGATLVRTVCEQLAIDESELPAPLPTPLTRAEQDNYKKFKATVRSFAENIDIAPELVLRKKEIEHLFRLMQNNQWDDIETSFSGWRAEIIAETVIKALKEL